jgi:hypothetical protein
VYDNGWDAIDLWDGGNAELAAPAVLDYDLPEGTVTGGTCSDCTVEIFSDSSDEGEIYEGQTRADVKGYFTFDKQTSFVGPRLTATTTDVTGNTSAFSVPTTGTVRSLLLQQGNHLPVAQLRPRHSRDLLDNRMGVQLDSIPYEINWDPLFYSIGVKRARVALSGGEPEQVEWDKPEFYVHPGQDALFDRMVENGVTITYVLMFWDKETWPNGEGAPCARFKTEGEIQRYLDFVRFIVRHFKDRVQYYELWNEPDIRNYCPKWIQVDDYLNLARRTIPVIREEYPEAKIVVGSVSNLRFWPAEDYLFEVIQSDIMPLVDVVAWHPLYGSSPEYEVYREYYHNYPALAQQIKETTVAHGFDGEYQADELTYRTPATYDPGQPWVYSPVVADKYLTRGVLMHLGMDIGVGIGQENATVRNLCTLMAGAAAESFPMHIQAATAVTITDTMSYSFALPYGNHMVALWTDGVALDYDPGVPTMLTLPGFTNHTVVGVDILRGYEQPIVTSVEGGDLVIRDLLVKDYPTIVKLISTKRLFLPALQ